MMFNNCPINTTEPGCSSGSKRGKNKNSIETECKSPTKTDESKANCLELHKLHITKQVYQDRLAGYRKQLRQLEDGTHEKYVKGLEQLELQKEKELIDCHSREESMREAIKRDFEKSYNSGIKFLDDQKREIKKKLETELLEKKKAYEYEYLTMELSLDSSEEQPTMLRKLRRRPNDPAVPPPQEKQEKRRKPPQLPNIRYMLLKSEIEEDLKAIREFASMPSTSTTAETTLKTQDSVISSSDTKSGFLQSSSSLDGNLSPIKCDSSDDELSSTISSTRIEDGKLLYQKRWYHRGQTIFVEGKKLATFSAVISTISNGTIWVKKMSDNSKFRIYLSYLAKGKISIKRSAAL